ncbi:MAG: aminotransferase class IV [bacterium]|nr:aminotransferase class IV [bacterium]
MPKKFDAGRFVWLNGILTETDPRRAIALPALSQALDYARVGISGIRVTPHFQDPNTLLIFSLYEHLVRIEDTCKRLGMYPEFQTGELFTAVLDVVKANAAILANGGYLRALIYDDRQVIAPQPEGPAQVAIYAAPFGEYIAEGDFRVTFDEILRTGELGRAKAAANYVRLSAAQERGRKLKVEDVIGVTIGRLGQLILGEGTTSSLFICLRGRIYAPPLDAGVLAGITRMRVLQLARDMGYPAYEMDVPISWIPLAEEMFLTGTASYVAPITHFGRHQLETAVGEKLNQRLRAVMRGEIEKYSSWNTPVKID